MTPPDRPASAPPDIPAQAGDHMSIRVAGATSGFGLAIARRFAKTGHKVVAASLVGRTGFSNVRFRGDGARAAGVYDGADALTPENVADAVFWAATRPARENINVIELMPVTQAFGPLVVHRGDQGGRWVRERGSRGTAMSDPWRDRR
jgi:NADP-dependent 3-hydroxy acid dehydrogenase YdfG